MIATVTELTKLLTDAAQAHHTFEQTLGHADPQWQAWYAQWIVERTSRIQPLAAQLDPHDARSFYGDAAEVL